MIRNPPPWLHPDRDLSGMTPHRIRSIRYYRQLWYARPPWADTQAINKLYEKAAWLGLTVDHIIPINHPYICGLHVFNNLQLLTVDQNIKKSNNHHPDQISLNLSGQLPLF